MSSLTTGSCRRTTALSLLPPRDIIRRLQCRMPFDGHTKKRVLVVDDSATMRRMIIASLTAIGDVVFEQAISGLEAIERITLSGPDLVMLDLNMPDVHGLEVLRFIRSQPALRDL